MENGTTVKAEIYQSCLSAFLHLQAVPAWNTLSEEIAHPQLFQATYNVKKKSRFLEKSIIIYVIFSDKVMEESLYSGGYTSTKL